ncbi:NUDIX domain-containing protein [Halobacillus litoralis]|uniref:NUDIX domain-containing protein n=1 Tax=Halobacillus litoralis TaxID=45668 RepID=A0A845E4J9_9BACI|nr:NUDIX domain-containing protein [Halobacillus litoralis]MYL50585.1 NUDIX domain-containing protein [Halobacillus litoralis]
MNDYIQTMRQMIGHETLLTVGCGAIIEDSNGRILLQKRSDHGVWGIPGGLLEIGETFDAAVKREVKEETGLELKELDLFGIYSGESGFATYENGDKVFSVQIVFRSTCYEGKLATNHESKEQAFFHADDIQENLLNPHQAPFLLDWMKGVRTPVIR